MASVYMHFIQNESFGRVHSCLIIPKLIGEVTVLTQKLYANIALSACSQLVHDSFPSQIYKAMCSACRQSIVAMQTQQMCTAEII